MKCSSGHYAADDEPETFKQFMVTTVIAQNYRRVRDSPDEGWPSAASA